MKSFQYVIFYVPLHKNRARAFFTAVKITINISLKYGKRTEPSDWHISHRHGAINAIHPWFLQTDFMRIANHTEWHP